MIVQDKLAVVIGGAQGIGLAYCEALLKDGAKVYFGDILEDKGKETKDELSRKYGEGNVEFQVCSVTKIEDIENLFDSAQKKFQGKVDIFVNNAGIANETDWARCLDVNLGGVIRCTETAFKHMGKDQGGKGGVIIHTASISGLRPEPWGPVYSASKHAVVAFTRSWALPKSYEKHGVRLNCICPTTVDTPFLQAVLKDTTTLYQEDTHEYLKVVDRITPDTVAEALMRLVKDDTANGQAMMVTKEWGIKPFEFPETPLQ